MSANKSNDIFDKRKKSICSSNDLSRKGNIDEAISNLIDFINSLTDYVTTSSCSGRIIILKKGEGESSKKDCKWILTSHTTVDPNDIVEKLCMCKEKNLILKFEPFILHVKCRDLNAAKKMQDCALAAGYRNSGTVFGRHNTITLAVRSTLGMEVPLSDEDGSLIVTSDYIVYVINKANEKMSENLKRIQSFSRSVFGLNSVEEPQERSLIKDNGDSR